MNFMETIKESQKDNEEDENSIRKIDKKIYDIFV